MPRRRRRGVYIDALLRHLQWTGDREFAREMWPVIVRHLAREQRLFRRDFGREKLPLYEAYAAIWASDDLQYHGGGVMHASAYNYYHHQQAARLARLLGANPAPLQREAQLLERGMRAHLWLPDRGWFAEFKDRVGLRWIRPPSKGAAGWCAAARPPCSSCPCSTGGNCSRSPFGLSPMRS